MKELINKFNNIDWKLYKKLNENDDIQPMYDVTRSSNGWFYNQVGSLNYVHHVNGIIYNPNGPAVVSKLRQSFYEKVSENKYFCTSFGKSGNVTHYYRLNNQDKVFHHPYMPHAFNLHEFEATKKFKDSDLCAWKINGNISYYHISAWMKEMGMDVNNLSDEDKVLCQLKWN